MRLSPSSKHPVPAPPKHPLTQPVLLPTQASVRRQALLPRRAVVLVGPMAAGKTSLGRRVAKELGVPFVDSDAVFQQRHGLITKFFEQRGEAAFRRIEAEIIAEQLAVAGARVIALGGGAVLTESTRKLLREHPVILLMTTQDAVLRTTKLSRRPLLRDNPEAWNSILAARKPFYEQVADVTFRTDRGRVDQLTEHIVDWVRARGRSEARRKARRKVRRLSKRSAARKRTT